MYILLNWNLTNCFVSNWQFQVSKVAGLHFFKCIDRTFEQSLPVLYVLVYQFDAHFLLCIEVVIELPNFVKMNLNIEKGSGSAILLKYFQTETHSDSPFSPFLALSVICELVLPLSV